MPDESTKIRCDIDHFDHVEVVSSGSGMRDYVMIRVVEVGKANRVGLKRDKIRDLILALANAARQLDEKENKS